MSGLGRNIALACEHPEELATLHRDERTAWCPVCESDVEVRHLEAQMTPMTADAGKPGKNSDMLTDEERKAIAALERLAKRWPQSLKLFSWSGTLCVVRTDDSLLDNPETAVIAHIEGIPNDGGDP